MTDAGPPRESKYTRDVNGKPVGELMFSKDGTRAYQVTRISRRGGLFRGWDIATGREVGFGPRGEPIADGLRLSEDGTRAYQTTLAADDYVNSEMWIIDANRGTPIAHHELPFRPCGGPVVSKNGTRACQVTSGFPGGTRHTFVCVVDGAHGARVGEIIDLAGEEPVGALALSEDGTRAYQSTYSHDEAGRCVASTAVIDTIHGTLVAKCSLGSGQPVGGPLVSKDGTHAYQVITNPDVTLVVSIDAATDPPQTRPIAGVPGGKPVGALRLSEDGTHACQTFSYREEGSDGSGRYMTQVVVIDTRAV